MATLPYVGLWLAHSSLLIVGSSVSVIRSPYLHSMATVRSPSVLDNNVGAACDKQSGSPTRHGKSL